MAPLRLATFVLAFAFAVADASSSFLHQSAKTHLRGKTIASLRFSPKDPAAQTLVALDTNHDGSIDPDEIAAFAEAQGLDAKSATQEFSSIDSNGDGVLDSTELKNVLGSSPPQKVAVREQNEHIEAPIAVAPPAAAQATSIALGADSIPKAASEDIDEVVSIPKAAAAGQLISEDSRTSVRMAAQKVAADLALEETEETTARDFDKKAAERHADSVNLAKATVRNAIIAGANAAHTKSDALMVKISQLESDALKAEVRAAALMAKSKLETQQGNELMAAAHEALKPVPNKRM